MIRKVSFRNFKAYRSLDVELEPFTVLVGPNASGKTTLLEGLQHLSDFATFILGSNSVNLDLEAPTELRAYGSSTPMELSATGNWNQTEGSFRAVSTEVVPGVTEPGHETRPMLAFEYSGEWGGKRFSSSKPEVAATLMEFRALWNSTRILRFEPRRLGEASYSEEAFPLVHMDGSGLASVLAYLKLSQDELFGEIELALKQIVPSVRRIRIERAQVERTAVRTISLDEQRHQVSEKRVLWGNQIVLDMKGAKSVAANAAGEGTLMALGLLTVLMGPLRPRLVLLDDIELALHPAAQAKLIEVLRAIQKRDPGLQIIATSHSPFILNYLEPREVRMTFLAENGFARCEKLTAHPDFEKWKGLMSPGEFWSTVGEGWLEKAGETSASE